MKRNRFQINAKAFILNYQSPLKGVILYKFLIVIRSKSANIFQLVMVPTIINKGFLFCGKILILLRCTVSIIILIIISTEKLKSKWKIAKATAHL